MMSIRIKSILTVTIASILGTSFLWVFNIYYVLRDWSLFWDGFATFFAIVLFLVIATALVVFYFFKPISASEIKFSNNETLSNEEDKKLMKAMSSMPLLIILINIVGFFVGPVSKHIIAAIGAGNNPFNLTLLTSVIFSVSIGFYIAFIEIRLLEAHFQFLHMHRGNESTLLDQRKFTWAGRQFLLGMTILTITFGLFFSAGKGYLSEELLAPSKMDGISSASQTEDFRVQAWSKALQGEILDLNESSPEVRARLSEYVLKMGLLGLIVLAVCRVDKPS